MKHIRKDWEEEDDRVLFWGGKLKGNINKTRGRTRASLTKSSLVDSTVDLSGGGALPFGWYLALYASMAG